MKIGILTFHRSVNNGAYMQAYSLAHRLRMEYPDDTVEIIDYHMPKLQNLHKYTLKSYLKSKNLKVFLYKLCLLAKDPLTLKRLNTRANVFKNALSMLPLSGDEILDDDANKLFNYINENYDVLIVGSDAVWNYKVRGFPNAYFPDNRVTARKLSYAASCYGMDFLSCPSDVQEKIGKILDDFDFIGVRDDATENFVKWSGSSSAPVHTCDPTMFLDLDKLPACEDLLKAKLRKRGFDFERPTIGIMASQEMLNLVKTLYGNTYQIVSLYEYVKGADVNLYDLAPAEWALCFKYFKLTFTIFFHGTMLSLRSGVPLICISRDTEFAKNHTPKTLDALSRLGFGDWYFETDYVSKNFDEIKAKADELLASQPKDLILERVNEEAQSFDAFKAALDNIRSEIENG